MAINIIPLKKTADYKKISQLGDSFATKSLILLYRMNTETNKEAEARVGFTVSKKVGGAVIRNRARRRLKAVAAEIMPKNAQNFYDYVIIGRRFAFDRDFQLLKADLQFALKNIHKTDETK